MKDKPLVENAVLPHTETKKLAHPFIFHSSLPVLVPIRSALFLFQTNFVNWQCKAFVHFYNGKRVHPVKEYSLFNLLVKKCFDSKITYV